MALLILSACGDSTGGEPTDEGNSTGPSVELLADDTEETVEASRYTVDIDVPDGWYEVDPKAGFHYQYLWEGNDWDDILAQDFDTLDYTFSGEFFVGLLEESLGSKSTITVRSENSEFASYRAIIIDVAYDSGSFTSLTYVNVEGSLWEFTVNSQTPEGLRRGEEINATAEFNIN